MTAARILHNEHPTVATFSRSFEIIPWVRQHPRRAIFLVALASVIASCYPIVFFGRSFVSGNAVPMLYSSIPSVPGHAEVETEDFKGSDAGAIMWHDVPNSVIQHRAIFQDGELPLWNRYNSCGLTLLGQGQSMFGDPLHMLVVAIGGDAWAWDLKFVAAKILFCFGLGLLVLAACRHLPTALLLTASAAFIGFFSYRFNHPAFFSVCYAPWLLLCWLEVTRSTTARAAGAWSAGLFLASWAELNSGTAKEAYMLLLCLHGSGLLIFLLTPGPIRGRKLLHLAVAGVVFLLVGMPVWLTFFEALQKAYVPYKEAALAYQIQPGLLLGFFDEIFYRAANPRWNVFDPSLNFFALLGCLFAVIYLRRLIRDPVFLAVAISALVSASLVFGMIPPSILQRIPMVNHIWHIDNTFSCVLLIQAFVLAGFGFQSFSIRATRSRWRVDFGFLVLLLLVLLGAYVGFTHVAQRLPNEWSQPEQAVPGKFFYRYSFTIFASLLALPWLFRMMLRTGKIALFPLVTALLCLACLHWRHGLHLPTGLKQVDEVVMNPPPRVDLQVSSPALDHLHQQPGAFRVAGFGSVLFPGYNGIPGLESIYGPDPLANPYYHDLLTAAGVRQEWSWRWIVEPANAAPRPLYAMLNIRYFLTMLSREKASPSYVDKPPLDLQVIENSAAWPRAFFVGNAVPYEKVGNFVEMLHGAAKPFAAIDKADPEAAVPQVTPAAAEAFAAARDYRLTNNTTTFTVDAPSAGVAVLTEAYVPDDFRVTVNGVAAKYFRVNHAFRGVNLPAAGKYEISYSYWPRHFTLSLIFAAVGVLILVVWLFTIRRSGDVAVAG